MDIKTERYILNILRQGTITWKGRTECLNAARKRFRVGLCVSEGLSGKFKFKWLYLCAMCDNYFDLPFMEVDHIVEIGSFNGNFDEYIRKMYCDQENLQALCTTCHKHKTRGFIASRDFVRKERK